MRSWLPLAGPGALLLVACGGGGGEAGDGPRDTLVVAWPADVESLMSVVPQAASDADVLGLLNATLLAPRFDCGLEFDPLVAESWSFSEDGATLDLALAPGFRWTDGAPLTAEDVGFTFDLVADPKVASPRRPFIEHMDPAARPEAKDATHLTFRFTHAYDRATMLAHAAGLELLPRHVLGAADRENLRGHPYHDAPVTSGPWRLESRERGQRLVLVPNERWSGDESLRPRLRRVVFKVLPEYTARVMELEAGSVDMVAGLQVSDAERIAAEHPEIALHRRGWRAMEYVGWNTLDPAGYRALKEAAPPDAPPDPARAPPHPLFGDPAVRRALGRAIDVDRLIEDLLTSKARGERYGRRAVGTITPSLCRAHADDIQPLAHDPAAARRELLALGWQDRDGDGVLDRDGVPFRFRLLLGSGNARRENAAVLVQAWLKEIGVDVRLEVVDFTTFVDRAVAKDFDALLGGWSADLFVDPTAQWGSDPGNVYNFVSYRNPQVDALLAAGLSEPDPERAAVHWRELQRVIHEDQPYTFLYWMDEIVAVHGRFQGADPDLVTPLGHLHRWWVPADQVRYTR